MMHVLKHTRNKRQSVNRDKNEQSFHYSSLFIAVFNCEVYLRCALTSSREMSSAMSLLDSCSCEILPNLRLIDLFVSKSSCFK